MVRNQESKLQFCMLIEDELGSHIPSLDKMHLKDLEALYYLIRAKSKHEVGAA